MGRSPAECSISERRRWPGAAVTVRSGDEVVGSTRSGADGGFVVPDVPMGTGYTVVGGTRRTAGRGAQRDRGAAGGHCRRRRVPAGRSGTRGAAGPRVRRSADRRASRRECRLDGECDRQRGRRRRGPVGIGPKRPAHPYGEHRRYGRDRDFTGVRDSAAWPGDSGGAGDARSAVRVGQQLVRPALPLQRERRRGGQPGLRQGQHHRVRGLDLAHRRRRTSSAAGTTYAWSWTR